MGQRNSAKFHTLKVAFLLTIFFLSNDIIFVESQSDNPVIIVGGGAAGLTAGKRLKENGVPVLILEGRDRLGGRIHTIEVSEKQPSTVDMGAAWVDGVPRNYVYDVTLEAGLEVVTQEYSAWGKYGIFNENNDSGWMSWLEEIIVFIGLSFFFLRASLTRCKPGTSIASQMSFLEESSNVRKLMEILIGGGTGAWINDVSCRVIFETGGYELESESMIYGGYGELIDFLGQSLSEDEVLLNQTVTSINVEDLESDSSVRVTTSDGTFYMGSHVIVTVPLGVLKTDMITFSPPLSDEKLDAINRAGFGVVEKIVFTFETMFWRINPEKHFNIVYLSDVVPPRFGYFYDCSETAGSPTLVAVLDGVPAIELSTDQETFIEEAKNILESLYTDVYESPVDVAVSSFFSDPHSRGSYSFSSINSFPEDADILAEPEQNERVLFAGDGTYKGLFNVVEGAMLSGLREAERIVASIK